MTKYHTWSDEITKVNCVKETPKAVWVKKHGQVYQHLKRTSHDCYFDSHEEAVGHIIIEAQKNVSAARNTLKYYEGKLAQIKAKFQAVSA